VAGTTRLELATSAVTGQRSNQLNYVPTRQINDWTKSLAGQGFRKFRMRRTVPVMPAVAAVPANTANLTIDALTQESNLSIERS
jgi:hypothetical protein